MDGGGGAREEAGDEGLVGGDVVFLRAASRIRERGVRAGNGMKLKLADAMTGTWSFKPRPTWGKLNMTQS